MAGSQGQRQAGNLPGAPQLTVKVAPMSTGHLSPPGGHLSCKRPLPHVPEVGSSNCTSLAPCALDGDKEREPIRCVTLGTGHPTVTGGTRAIPFSPSNIQSSLADHDLNLKGLTEAHRHGDEALGHFTLPTPKRSES